MTAYPIDAPTVQPGGADATRRRAPIAAFVPIALALIGVGAIMFGGLQARDPATAISSIGEVDMISTGSITPRARGAVEIGE